MDGANVYPKGRQRYVYLGGKRPSPLPSLIAAPKSYFFFKPIA